MLGRRTDRCRAWPNGRCLYRPLGRPVGSASHAEASGNGWSVPRYLSDLWPVGARVYVSRSARLTPQPAMDIWEGQAGSKLSDQSGERQHCVVVAAVAPAEDINAIALHVGKRRRLGKVVGHPDRLMVIWAGREVETVCLYLGIGSSISLTIYSSRHPSITSDTGVLEDLP